MSSSIAKEPRGLRTLKRAETISCDTVELNKMRRRDTLKDKLLVVDEESQSRNESEAKVRTPDAHGAFRDKMTMFSAKKSEEKSKNQNDWETNGDVFRSEEEENEQVSEDFKEKTKEMSSASRNMDRRALDVIEKRKFFAKRVMTIPAHAFPEPNEEPEPNFKGKPLNLYCSKSLKAFRNSKIKPSPFNFHEYLPNKNQIGSLHTSIRASCSSYNALKPKEESLNGKKSDKFSVKDYLGDRESVASGSQFYDLSEDDDSDSPEVDLDCQMILEEEFGKSAFYSQLVLEEEEAGSLKAKEEKKFSLLANKIKLLSLLIEQYSSVVSFNETLVSDRTDLLISMSNFKMMKGIQSEFDWGVYWGCLLSGWLERV